MLAAQQRNCAALTCSMSRRMSCTILLCLRSTHAPTDAASPETLRGTQAKAFSTRRDINSDLQAAEAHAGWRCEHEQHHI